MTMDLFVKLNKYFFYLTFYAVSLIAVAEEHTFQFQVDYYQIQGDNPFSAEKTTKLLQAYTGTLSSLEQIQQAVDHLQTSLNEAGYGFYQVILAPQTLDKNFIILEIKPINIAKISVLQSEKSPFSEENIKRSMSEIQSDHSPNLNRVAQQVELANKNPGKKTNVQFAISEKPGMIDADIIVNTEKVEEFFAWINNTGDKETGDYRMGIGYSHYNLFDYDDQLALTFTTSPDHPKDVQQYGLNYQIPLYQLPAIFQLYAYYSDVDSGIVAGGFDVSGRGTFLGLSLQYFLPQLLDKNFNQSLRLSLDDNLFNNDVFFAQEQLATDVRATPLALAYEFDWKTETIFVDFKIRYAANLELGSKNDRLSYALSRYQASPNWDIVTLDGSFSWLNKGYIFMTRVSAQYSDQPLISGVQFGLGGLTAGVRGFNEREIIADRGIRANFELWFPVIEKYQISPLLYVDAGYVDRLSPLADELSYDSIAAVGAGISYSYRKNINLNLFLSHVVDGNNSLNTIRPSLTGDNALQFNLNFRY